MAEIVNFRRAKKTKARQAEAKDAEANRVKFGVPKSERDLAKARKEKSDQHISGHNLKPRSDHEAD